ncbi:DUF1445 domain-containing protein [Arthrobacter sp. StoSoilB3]|nr:hypothetical protein ASF74_20815 [Arthrobacter sp. Leaf145]BCW40267.1 DUF1445 domain-containing protein [Arthrobacter sp. StoSoilB3]
MITSPAQLRDEIRAANWTGPTAGMLRGYQQANFVAVPEAHAFDFLLFCVRNPQVCPVIAVTAHGDPWVNLDSGTADVRTDIPRYRVWKSGELVEEPVEVSKYWTGDMVGFLLGCSHTFEGPLADAGYTVRQHASPAPPVYITNRQTVSAGKIHGPLAVSMRSFPAGQVAGIVKLTARYPTGHGSPIHIGDPAGLGITDLLTPDFGPTPEIPDGEVPMFWACGVTPQLVLPRLGMHTLITHYPGHMFVFDNKPVPEH